MSEPESQERVLPLVRFGSRGAPSRPVPPPLGLGAHFGIEAGDPMWPFMRAMFQGLTEERTAWAWMLVEPVPPNVAQLRANLKTQVRAGVLPVPPPWLSQEGQRWEAGQPALVIKSQPLRGARYPNRSQGWSGRPQPPPKLCLPPNPPPPLFTCVSLISDRV